MDSFLAEERRSRGFNLIDTQEKVRLYLQKTRVCRYTYIGCTNKSCTFAHNKDEIIPRICPFGESCSKASCDQIHPGQAIPSKEQLWEDGLKIVNPSPIPLYMSWGYRPSVHSPTCTTAVRMLGDESLVNVERRENVKSWKEDRKGERDEEIRNDRREDRMDTRSWEEERKEEIRNGRRENKREGEKRGQKRKIEKISIETASGSGSIKIDIEGEREKLLRTLKRTRDMLDDLIDNLEEATTTEENC